MSPRRKIALWLCPELGERPVAQVDYYPSAQGWVRDTLRNAEAATDAAWKAEVLELLKAGRVHLAEDDTELVFAGRESRADER